MSDLDRKFVIETEETHVSEWIERENPTHPAEIVGRVPASSPADVDTAVRAADAAQKAWAALSLQDRLARIRGAAAALPEHNDRLGRLMAREVGKPFADARGEIGYSQVLLGYTLDRAPEVVSDVEVDDDAGRMLIRHEPFGVVAAITPWNAPVILTMLKVAPALATGNAVVVKPSPLAPLAVTEFFELLAAGLPAGLLTVVHGGAEAGSALVAHPLVRKIAFTGGNTTAVAIGRTAAEVITPTVMELGGNDPAIFLDDADLGPDAMDRIVVATFATSGQVCMASKRIYVHRSRYDEFVAAFVAAAERVLRTGDPLDDGVTMGPVIDARSRERVDALIASAVQAGGTATPLGTVDETVFAEGYFVRPTLVTGIEDAHPLVCDEQFGPVVPVSAFDTDDEAVARANAGELGLGASVWSGDEERAFALARRLEAGFTFVNTHNRTGMAPRAPFGGVKKSGFGREYGDEGLKEYLQICVVNAPAAFRTGGSGGSATAYPGQA
jgi:acyl-CoA reductase-like NAD-dependent aldehyde dehydrogenase